MQGYIQYSNGSDMQYVYQYSTTPDFANAVSSPAQNITATGGEQLLPPLTVNGLPNGDYYVRVVAIKDGGRPTEEINYSSTIPVKIKNNPVSVTTNPALVFPVLADLRNNQTNQSGDVIFSGTAVFAAGTPMEYNYIFGSSLNQSLWTSALATSISIVSAGFDVVAPVRLNLPPGTYYYMLQATVMSGNGKKATAVNTLYGNLVSFVILPAAATPAVSNQSASKVRYLSVKVRL